VAILAQGRPQTKNLTRRKTQQERKMHRWGVPQKRITASQFCTRFGSRASGHRLKRKVVFRITPGLASCFTLGQTLPQPRHASSGPGCINPDN